MYSFTRFELRILTGFAVAIAAIAVGFGVFGLNQPDRSRPESAIVSLDATDGSEELAAPLDVEPDPGPRTPTTTQTKPPGTESTPSTSTPSTSPPTTNPRGPDPVPPTTEPLNQAPVIEDISVESSGSQVRVMVKASDPEGRLAEVGISVIGGGTTDSKVPVLVPIDSQSQIFDGEGQVSAEFTFSVSTEKVAQRSIVVSAYADDDDGERSQRSVDHQVIRRIALMLSPIRVHLGRACYGSLPAVALIGEVTVTGTAFSTTAKVVADVEKATRTSLLLVEQEGFADGEEPWFARVALRASLHFGSEITDLGNLAEVHTTSGQFAQSFEANGCAGSIRYTITAKQL